MLFNRQAWCVLVTEDAATVARLGTRWGMERAASLRIWGRRMLPTTVGEGASLSQGSF